MGSLLRLLQNQGWGIFYEKMSAPHSKEASFLYIRGVLD